MELVSSFFENILTVESGTGQEKGTIGSSSRRSSRISPVSSAEETDDHVSSEPKPRSGSIQSLDSYPERTIDVKIPPHGNPDAIKDISSFWYLNVSYEDSKKPANIMTDRLVEKIILMVIPETTKDSQVLNDRIVMQSQRPQLSMNIMSKNSVLLNQRASVLFHTVDNVIKFIGWYNPFLTVGVLLIITHLILNPYLVLVLPMFLLINNVLIPHYLVRYPPDNSQLNKFYSYNPAPFDSKKPLKNYKTPQPVPQFSKEFILNLTDLQNHMILYIKAYDFVIWLTTDYLYFKNEELSSLILVFITMSGIVTLASAPYLLPLLINYLPIKLLLIMNTWGSLILCHPHFRTSVLDAIYTEDSRFEALTVVNNLEKKLIKTLVEEPTEVLDDVRYVEIFELQKLNMRTKIWEPIGFGNDFYSVSDPIRQLKSNLYEEFEDEAIEQIRLKNYELYQAKYQETLQQVKRINNDKKIDAIPEVTEDDDINQSFSYDEDIEMLLIKNSQKSSFNDIKPPKSWQFVKESHWEIDLDANGWVERNFIQDLVSIDSDEKWVYDFINDNENETGAGVFRRRRWLRGCVRCDVEAPVEKMAESIYSADRLSKSFSNFLL